MSETDVVPSLPTAPLPGKTASKLSADLRQPRPVAGVFARILKPRSSEVPSATGQAAERVAATSSTQPPPVRVAGLLIVIAQPLASVTGSPHALDEGVGVGVGWGVGEGDGLGDGLGLGEGLGLGDGLGDGLGLGLGEGLGDGLGLGLGDGLGVGAGRGGAVGSVRTATWIEAVAFEVPAFAERL